MGSGVAQVDLECFTPPDGPDGTDYDSEGPEVQAKAPGLTDTQERRQSTRNSLSWGERTGEGQDDL